MSSVDRRALGALRAKYVEMRRMRELNDAGSEGDPTPSMRALAASFPGALREIDELSLATIDARIDALGRAIEHDAPEPWMIALARYHASLRRALRLRRAVSERSITHARAWLATSPSTDDELGALAPLDDAALAAILRPPDGRLNRVILEHVAHELDITPTWLESLLRGQDRSRKHP